MTADSKSSPPSFSTGRRWKIGLDIALRTILVLAVVVMANYIGSIFPHQFFFSSQTRIKLSPRTASILQTLTNRVDVTVYYDKKDGMFPDIMALLNEYHRLNRRIHVQVVDYLRNPGEAAQVAQKYHIMSESAGKNLVIFDCEGRDKIAPGKELVQYGPTGMEGTNIVFRPVAFYGEKMFTSMLLAVTNPKPFTAYFLQGDGEPKLDDSTAGYLEFAELLQEDYIRIAPLSIVGSQDIPGDCDLLIIAGPTQQLSESEVGKIQGYLSKGGRMLALLSYGAGETQIEDLLAQWGVNVRSDCVIDPDNAINGSDAVMGVQNFSEHPAINSLSGSSLIMQTPRPILSLNNSDTQSDSLTVTPLAMSSADSVLSDVRGMKPQSYALMVAIEQKPVKGIGSANGGMRIIVAGDANFLNNEYLGQVAANGDFASSAVNWLLDRPMGLNGIGPQPVTEFRLFMTQAQMRGARWLLLAALPCVALALGGLVWLRRRK